MYLRHLRHATFAYVCVTGNVCCVLPVPAYPDLDDAAFLRHDLAQILTSNPEGVRSSDIRFMFLEGTGRRKSKRNIILGDLAQITSMTVLPRLLAHRAPLDRGFFKVRVPCANGLQVDRDCSTAQKD